MLTYEQLVNVFALLPAGIDIHSYDGNVIDLNSKSSNTLCLTKEQLLGEMPFDPEWRAIKDDGSDFLIEHLVMMVSSTREEVNNITVCVRSHAS
ncbi:PAS domain-containing protein [Solidesulfovibrio sp.]|uniref:PAS domain-containing protein n=1 Tax=Solidesulfovibrio sp. TaxID=2910990 RepID=UPI00262A1C94|nr:PAS domain-containing protein [Solidesulfovibrio sp.]